MANPISKLSLVINGVTTQLDVHDANAIPTGCYIQFAGSQAPTGFLVCNGGAVSRTTYSKLFAVIGTRYGSGDGRSTFNLPNLTDRFLQGSSTSGTIKDAGLPNIAGYVNGVVYNSMGSSEGSMRVTNGEPAYIGSGDRCGCGNLTFDASRSSSIYGNSTTVQPPALTCLICIKY